MNEKLELAVWAAAFVKNFHIWDPPPYVLPGGGGTRETWDEWESREAKEAADRADVVVRHLKSEIARRAQDDE